jgi:hypothetical protein
VVPSVHCRKFFFQTSFDESINIKNHLCW